MAKMVKVCLWLIVLWDVFETIDILFSIHYQVLLFLVSKWLGIVTIANV